MTGLRFLIALPFMCLFGLMPTLAAAQCDRTITPHPSGIPGPETGRLPVVSLEFDEVLRVAAETYFNPRNELYVEMARNDQAGKMVAVVGHVLGKQRFQTGGDPLKQSMYNHWVDEYRAWMQGIVDYRCYHKAPYVPRERFWTQAQEAMKGLYEDRINQLYGPRHVRAAYNEAFKSGGQHAAMLLGQQDQGAINLLGQNAPATDHLTPPPSPPPDTSGRLTQDDFNCIRCRHWTGYVPPGQGYANTWYDSKSLPFLKGRTPPNIGGDCKSKGLHLCCNDPVWNESDSTKDETPEPAPFGGRCYCVDSNLITSQRKAWSKASSLGNTRFCW